MPCRSRHSLKAGPGREGKLQGRGGIAFRAGPVVGARSRGGRCPRIDGGRGSRQVGKLPLRRRVLASQIVGLASRTRGEIPAAFGLVAMAVGTCFRTISKPRNKPAGEGAAPVHTVDIARESLTSLRTLSKRPCLGDGAGRRYPRQFPCPSTWSAGPARAANSLGQGGTERDHPYLGFARRCSTARIHRPASVASSSRTHRCPCGRRISPRTAVSQEHARAHWMGCGRGRVRGTPRRQPQPSPTNLPESTGIATGAFVSGGWLPRGLAGAGFVLPFDVGSASFQRGSRRGLGRARAFLGAPTAAVMLVVAALGHGVQAAGSRILPGRCW